MTFRPAEHDDVDAILRLNQQGFNASPADAERYRTRMKLEQWRVIDDGAIKATLRWFPFAHFYGGRAVDAAGVASVAVDPGARGRGLGRALMDQTVREVRAAGVPISTLYPATVPLYRATGYGFGMIRTSWKAALGSLPDDRVDGVTVERLDGAGAVNELYERIAVTQNGLVRRDPEWWQRNVLTAWDGSERWAYLTRENGSVTGWIVYESSAINGSWRFKLSCRDLFWTTPGAARALVSMVALHRSTAEEIAWTGPPDDPLQWLMKDHAIAHDGSYHAMVRLLDVPAALEARGYVHADASFSIRVHDPTFPENAGPWRVDVADGSATISRSDTAGGECDVQTLASIWSSLLTPRDAVRLGMLRADGATVDAMEVAFAGPQPWIADFF